MKYKVGQKVRVSPKEHPRYQYLHVLFTVVQADPSAGYSYDYRIKGGGFETGVNGNSLIPANPQNIKWL